MTEIETVEQVRSTGQFVDRTVSKIQAQYVAPRQTPWSRAALAQLRRSVGRPLGAVPEVLELVVNPASPPTSGPPTSDERAIAAALALYAVHQQSIDKPMHVRGTRFGTALGKAARRGGEPVPGIVRRFQALGTAEEIDEVLHHARGLVQLLRTEKQGFDYGRFADDLAQFQDGARRDLVRLRWGRDFYRVSTSTESPESSESTSDTKEQ